MANIGVMSTDKTIEKAIKEIKKWLGELNINAATIVTNYEPRQNIALVQFVYQGKEYQFRSTKQKNCRLNMHAIAKVIEFKVRAQRMNIEDFSQSMQAYLAIEGTTEEYIPSNKKTKTDTLSYATLGLSPLCSNEELEKAHKRLIKTYHPDVAGTEEAKKIFTTKAQEINSAYTKIKVERGIGQPVIEETKTE